MMENPFYSKDDSKMPKGRRLSYILRRLRSSAGRQSKLTLELDFFAY